MTTVHTIPARDVEPGMMIMTIADEMRLVNSTKHGSTISIAYDGGFAVGLSPGDMFTVRLPAPSPRELCCRCCAHGCDLEDDRASAPELHAPDCPVAPRSGIHGGMRLWPAPFRGRAWMYDRRCSSYRCGGHAVWFPQFREPGERGAEPRVGDWRRREDMILQSFFYPPTPPEPTGDRSAWAVERAQKEYR